MKTHHIFLIVAALSLTLSAGCTRWFQQYGFESYGELRNPEAHPQLVNVVAGGGPDARRAAPHLVDADPEIIRPVMPQLIEIYAEGCRIGPGMNPEDEPWVHDQSCDALVKTATRFGEEAVPPLEKVNHFAATLGFSALGHRGRDGIHTLVAALGSEYAQVRVQAADALRNIGVPNERVIQVLGQLREADRDEGVRDAAARAHLSLLAAEERPIREEDPKHTINPAGPVERLGTPRPNDIALVIGIEDYRGELPDSTAARDDAKTFADLAESHLGLSRRNIIVLLDDQATNSSLESYLEDWLPSNAREDGRVYVFFAGHGAPDPQTGNSYLVPWDGDPRFITRQGISIDSLTARLQELPAQDVVLMLDSCFSGSGGRSVLAEGTRPLVPIKEIELEDKETDEGGFVMLAAAAANEVTGMTADGSHGLFSYYLFAGIRGEADQNADGQITLGELADHVAATVPDEARRENRSQTPVSRFLPDSAVDMAVVVFE